MGEGPVKGWVGWGLGRGDGGRVGLGSGVGGGTPGGGGRHGG